MTIHAVALRFGSSPNPPVPVPDTSTLPIFSDNVIPSLLIHLGVIDLSASTPSLGLQHVFHEGGSTDTLETLLGLPPLPVQDHKKGVPKEGPLLSEQQAFLLRAAAVDACELIVQVAQSLGNEDLQGPNGEDLKWLKEITLPELDAWIWAVGKDRVDYRRLERFALRNTTFF